MKYKKKLGQNFLHNQNILQKIADLVCDEKPDFILEIGAGNGALTQKLLQANIPLLAVELDIYWYKSLQKKFSHHSHFQVINGDILKLDWKKLCQQEKCAFVGNLPFQISTPIFFCLLNHLDLFEFFVIMFQKEFADRIVANKKLSAKNFGSLHVLADLFFLLKEKIFVGRNNFFPSPQVDAVLLKMKKTNFQLSNLQQFCQFLRHIFQQPRKTLWNNLKLHYSQQLDMLSNDNNKKIQQVRAANFTALEILDIYYLLTKKNYLSDKIKT